MKTGKERKLQRQNKQMDSLLSNTFGYFKNKLINLYFNSYGSKHFKRKISRGWIKTRKTLWGYLQSGSLPSEGS